MEQEGLMDFKALRAKFQEEAALKQMKHKPAIPEKPKLIPPPGAKVSLLSSINAAVENKTPFVPRVMFKDAKPGSETKRPLPVPVPFNTKDPVRDSNFNTELLDHLQKKEGDVVKKAFKDRKFPLVLPMLPVVEKPLPVPPAKSLLPKKKPYLPFKLKSSKSGKETPETSDDPTKPSVALLPPAMVAKIAEVAEVAEAVKVAEAAEVVEVTEGAEEAEVTEVAEVAEVAEVKDVVEIAEAVKVAEIAEVAEVAEMEEVTEGAEVAEVTQVAEVAEVAEAAEMVKVAEVTDVGALILENGNIPYEVGSGSEPQSPHSERAYTPPSIDDRAEEMSTGSSTPPCDQRVLNALENAKKKFLPAQARSKSASPVNGDESREMTPTRLCPELPPIDYEDPIRDVPSKQPTAIASTVSVSPDDELDGSAFRQSLERSLEQGVEDVQPGLQAIIPPPRKHLPDLESLGPSPKKPARPPCVDLSPYQTTAPEAYVENALQELPLEAPEFNPVEFEGFEALQLEAPEVPDFETSESEAQEAEASDLFTEYGEPGAPGLGAPESGLLELGDAEFVSEEFETPEAEALGTSVSESAPSSPVSPLNKESEPQPGLHQEEGHYESCDNVYEDVEAVSKFRRGQNTRKRKGPPKNPYADTQPVSEDSHKVSWFFNSRNERKVSPEAVDDKEQKKKEKHRLEKEKKEQKEREKKENEMKKKFKITGQEETMYHAKVTVASKGRKDDLPLNSGDIVSIIRTTNCPKGKWLARDSNNKYGYISVKSVQLDIKEMLELGKKASQAAGRSAAPEEEDVSVGSRTSNHYPLSTGSFTDDSEEWACDDDDTVSPTENKEPSWPALMPEMFGNHGNVQHIVTDGNSDDNNVQARNEALQKLATFFQQPRETSKAVEEEATAGQDATAEEEATVGTEEEPSLLCPVEEPTYLDELEEVMEILPPPELYADGVDDGLPSLPTIGME